MRQLLPKGSNDLRHVRVGLPQVPVLAADHFRVSVVSGCCQLSKIENWLQLQSVS